MTKNELETDVMYKVDSEALQTSTCVVREQTHKDQLSTHTYTHHTHMYIHTYTHTIHARIYIYTHHTHIHTHTHHTHMYIHTYTPYTHTHTPYTHVYTYIHTIHTYGISCQCTRYITHTYIHTYTPHTHTHILNITELQVSTSICRRVMSHDMASTACQQLPSQHHRPLNNTKLHCLQSAHVSVV